jgi:hypothetical protein
MSGSFVGPKQPLTVNVVTERKLSARSSNTPDEDTARRSVLGLVSELNTGAQPMNPGAMTVAQLCDHFEQRELAKENTWRSHATKRIYNAYLTRWVRPHWHKFQLTEVRTIQVQSWLRGLPLAKSRLLWAHSVPEPVSIGCNVPRRSARSFINTKKTGTRIST